MDVKESKFSLWKAFLTVFLITVIAVGIVFASIAGETNSIELDSDITLEIPEGAGAATIAEQLYTSGIIKYPRMFQLYSKMGGYDNDFLPGMITVKNGMSYNDILKTLVTNESRGSITIPEGYTLKQIAQLLASEGVCTEEDFYSALDPSLYDYKFLKDLPEREARMEGYLFPASYNISSGMSANDIVNLMLKTFNDNFPEIYYARATEMGLTIDEVITFASIIERETKADSERAKVAGVFYNRMKNNMNLESCATVQYILGENKPVLSDEDTKIDSPYNTYLYSGLPIGPIASPGADCIKAVLYPENTDAFFFVLGADGEHIFSKTFEEHTQAMQESGL